MPESKLLPDATTHIPLVLGGVPWEQWTRHLRRGRSKVFARMVALAFTGTMAVMTHVAQAATAILDFNDRTITASVPNFLSEDGYKFHSASANFLITVGENGTPGLSRRGTSGRITLTLADDGAFHLISFFSRSNQSYVVNGMVNGQIVASQTVPVSSTGTVITLTNNFNTVTSAEFMISANAETTLDNIHVGPPIPIPEASAIILSASGAMAALIFRRPCRRYLLHPQTARAEFSQIFPNCSSIL